MLRFFLRTVWWTLSVRERDLIVQLSDTRAELRDVQAENDTLRRALSHAESCFQAHGLSRHAGRCRQALDLHRKPDPARKPSY